MYQRQLRSSLKGRKVSHKSTSSKKKASHKRSSQKNRKRAVKKTEKKDQQGTCKSDAQGMVTCSRAAKGKREYMEDRWVIYKHQGWKFSAVFDGHGGHDVADWLVKHLASQTLDALISTKVDPSNKQDVGATVENVFLKADRQILSDLPETDAGSTAIVCLQYEKYIYLVTCGDSRAVLFNNKRIIKATKDHKPNLQSEKRRVEKLGHFIHKAPGDVWRVNDDLAMSRSFGDFTLKPGMNSHTSIKDQRSHFPVLALPTIQNVVLNSSDAYYVILASDGIWDVISNKEILQIATDFLAKHDGKMDGLCDMIQKEAFRRKTTDNVCTLCIELCAS